MKRIGELSVLIKPEFQVRKFETEVKKLMATANATKLSPLKKTVIEQEKLTKKSFDVNLKSTIKFNKQVLKIQLAYMRQGLSEEKANAKAIEESKLNEFQKAEKERERILKTFRDRRLKAELAAQKKAQRNSLRARTGRAIGQIGIIAAGTAIGNSFSKVSKAGKKGLSFASGFDDAMKELNTRDSLSKRFGERNKNELLKQFNAISIQTGENFDDLASTFNAINTQLGDVIGQKRQKQIFKSLTRFGDSFTSVADLANEYASSVESASISEGTELAKLLGGRRRARRYNQFTDQQNILVEAGFARDMGDESLIKAREKFLGRDLANTRIPGFKSNDAAVKLSTARDMISEEKLQFYSGTASKFYGAMGVLALKESIDGLEATTKGVGALIEYGSRKFSNLIDKLNGK